MKFDFKITTWETVTVAEKYEKEVLDAIKSGEITSSDDVYNYLEGKQDSDISCLYNIECVEQMTVDENGGCATIEVIKGLGDEIWNNAKEYNFSEVNDNMLKR